MGSGVQCDYSVVISPSDPDQPRLSSDAWYFQGRLPEMVPRARDPVYTVCPSPGMFSHFKAPEFQLEGVQHVT
jgi:hypothetical protein